MINVAINGFGRIGRMAFREMITSDCFNIVAINSLGDIEEMCHLLKYDTTYGNFHTEDITFDNEALIIKGKKRIVVMQEKDPINLPWKELNIDLVLECSGCFTKNDDLKKHITAGAKKVVLSAPAKDDVKTIVYGVNDNLINDADKIISAASCTTNCLAPVLNLLENNYGIQMCYMTTIHAYTSDQIIIDGVHKKGIYSRRGRNAANNIVPTATGAAKAIGLVIPTLKGKVDGNSVRVPVASGSLVDVTVELNNLVSKEDINNLFINNQNDTLRITFDPIVSGDIIKDKHGSIVDGNLTEVLTNGNKQFLKVCAWYDNEVGYTNQMLRVAKKLFNTLK